MVTFGASDLIWHLSYNFQDLRMTKLKQITIFVFMVLYADLQTGLNIAFYCISVSHSLPVCRPLSFGSFFLNLRSRYTVVSKAVKYGVSKFIVCNVYNFDNCSCCWCCCRWKLNVYDLRCLNSTARFYGSISNYKFIFRNLRAYMLFLLRMSWQKYYTVTDTLSETKKINC